MSSPNRTDFWVTCGTEQLRTSLIGASPKANILSIHGAGSASRERIVPLASHLAIKHKLTACCFDHSGNGDSTGDMANSCLAKRTAEALAMQPHLSEPIILIGTSMGAFTALECLAHFKVSHIILIVPAIYGDHTREVTFGPDFTNLIRQPGSYTNASALNHLRKFTNQVTLVTAQHDAIIPPEVITLYKQAINPSATFNHLEVPEAPHPLHKWLAKHPEKQLKFFEDISSLIQP